MREEMRKATQREEARALLITSKTRMTTSSNIHKISIHQNVFPPIKHTESMSQGKTFSQKHCKNKTHCRKGLDENTFPVHKL